jgi:hypothetical protein
MNKGYLDLAGVLYAVENGKNEHASAVTSCTITVTVYRLASRKI